MTFILAFAGLAIGFALPGLAQEQDEVDSEVRQQIEAVTRRREEAYNKHDAAAWSAFHPRRNRCLDVGTRWCGCRFASYCKKDEAEFASYPAPQSLKVVRVYAIGNEICAVMEYKHHMHAKGRALVIYVHDADDWKVRLSYVN